jgi:L-rhamnose mutarotase
MALDLKDDPALIDAYENIHRVGNIWPEIPVGIRDGGVVDMQIYRIGNHLFMLVDIDSTETITSVFEKIGRLPKQKEWAEFMGTFQQKLKEAGPNEHWVTMSPVFKLKDHLC